MALVDELWDDDAGYLLNGLDSTAMDRHYYTGSLLAAAFDLLDAAKRDTLIETARRELLDENVGVRNAMPMDYHLLTDVYHFQEGEVGHAGRVHERRRLAARQRVVRARADRRRARWTTRATLWSATSAWPESTDSPNGQPAFYEYRNADAYVARLRRYRQADVPVGGRLVPARALPTGGRARDAVESLAQPRPAEGFETVAYDLAVAGGQSRVSWSGTGDGVSTHRGGRRRDALGRPDRAASRIELERGVPTGPYLANASCLIDGVERGPDGSSTVRVRGVVGQRVSLDVVAPTFLPSVRVNGRASVARVVAGAVSESSAISQVTWVLEAPQVLVTGGL